MAADEPDAALALERWEELRRLGEQTRGAQHRFRRRAFERARDRALLALAMRVKPPMLARKPAVRTAPGRVRRPTMQRRGQPTRAAA